jgi:heme-degrading monooxygenase HmoA
MFTVIWKYEIREDTKAHFLELYGPSGKWAQLFKTGQGYLGTQLIRDVSASNMYVTIDRWTSRDRYEKFLMDNKEELERIDSEGEKLTINEIKIGWFEDNLTSDLETPGELLQR